MRRAYFVANRRAKTETPRNQMTKESQRPPPLTNLTQDSQFDRGQEASA